MCVFSAAPSPATGPGDESNPDGAEEEYNPDQPTFKQAGPVMMGYSERGNYTPPLRRRGKPRQ